MFFRLLVVVLSLWNGIAFAVTHVYTEEEIALASVKDLNAMAAEKNPLAQTELGLRYLSGVGVPQDDMQGLAWLKLASTRGYAGGQVALGYAYLYALAGLPKSPAEAMRLFELAAAQDFPAGKAALGEMYASGNGVEKDPRKAFEYFLGPASKGNRIAQYGLAVLLRKGEGTAQDYVRAVDWYRMAAAKGEARAMGELGWMHYAGYGTKKNVVQAHMWLNLASSIAGDRYTKARNAIAEEMSPAQLAQAQTLARECSARPVMNCDEAQNSGAKP